MIGLDFFAVFQHTDSTVLHPGVKGLCTYKPGEVTTFWSILLSVCPLLWFLSHLCHLFMVTPPALRSVALTHWDARRQFVSSEQRRWGWRVSASAHSPSPFWKKGETSMVSGTHSKVSLTHTEFIFFLLLLNRAAFCVFSSLCLEGFDLQRHSEILELKVWKIECEWSAERASLPLCQVPASGGWLCPWAWWVPEPQSATRRRRWAWSRYLLAAGFGLAAGSCCSHCDSCLLKVTAKKAFAAGQWSSAAISSLLASKPQQPASSPLQVHTHAAAHAWRPCGNSRSGFRSSLWFFGRVTLSKTQTFLLLKKIPFICQ